MRACLLALAASVLLAAAAPVAAGPMSSSWVTVRSSAYGRILFDGRGRALYAFTRDRRGPSACYGACAKAWPPYVAHGAVHAGRGVHGGLLGTVVRRGGARQVTYGGRPLYYYAGDARGEVRCQNVSEYGGVWLVVRATGRLVR